MKVILGVRQMFLHGEELERAGKFTEAAAVYQKIFDGDPSHQEVAVRLMIAYRKLKAYRQELSVINRALGSFEEREKEMQEKWLSRHPQAAAMGKAVLRNLGGRSLSGFGANSAVQRLQKRKEFVERRLGMAKTNGKAKASISKTHDREKPKTKVVSPDRVKKEAIQAKKRAIQARKEAARERKAMAAEQRRQVVQDRKVSQIAKNHPHLFVIIIRYLAPLDQIDDAMAQHVAFLNKFYKSGNILVSGRQEPRTGGIIIAKGKDRRAVEQMMKVDPFIRKKLASIDIIEFSASKMTKMSQWFQIAKKK